MITRLKKHHKPNWNRIKGKTCSVCDRDLTEYWKKPLSIIRSRTQQSNILCKTVYYCDDCYNDVFDGVKLRRTEILNHDEETEYMILQAIKVLEK